MIESHIDENELRKKITELFEYRLFPELLKEGGLSPNEIEIFWVQLIDLQTAIYHLDAHLEAHLEPSREVLKWHWANMTSKLENIVGPLTMNHDYFAHIEKYQKHELELRKGISPLTYDIFQFYYFKSCDVKLLRRLIYEKCDISTQFGTLEDWKYYDLITEVNDDVEDIWEDMTFVNGNLFLISILLQGIEKTENLYKKFMSKISQLSSDSIIHNTLVPKEFLDKVTQKRVKETQELMTAQLTDSRIFECKEARIVQLTNTML